MASRKSSILTCFVLFFSVFILARYTEASSSTVIIYALYYDTYLPSEPEEAFALMNISGSSVSITGWKVTDNEGTVTFPAYTLAAGQIIWVTKTATDFRSEFGFDADFEYGSNSDPAIPNLTGTAPVFANTGDECILKDASSATIDVLIYENGNTATAGWSGAAVFPWDNGDFGLEGQILYRKLDEANGVPVPDTDMVDDWAQTPNDNIDGKKVRYPGWDLERYFQTRKTTQSAHLEYWVAPDNVLENYLGYINSATQSIYIEGYTFKSMQIEQALVNRLQNGVQVKVLLEDEPVGGVEDQEKWLAQQIENNSGQVWFMYTDQGLHVHDRYDYQHSKFTIVDQSWLLTGSENLNASSMPADDKTNGTEGNRGMYIATDASDLVDHALDIFSHDLDPANHVDVRRWSAATDSPPVGFVPDDGGDPTNYPVQFWDPLVLDGTFDFEMVQSPDNTLRGTDSILGMINRAGVGGKVYVEQLYEYEFWGPTSSNPVTDPNLRLEAYISAARRGAEVKLLLDSVFDDPLDPRGNTSACLYVNGIASNESLNLECKVGSPTITGIHNKMILVFDGTDGWTHTGSINGSENSCKNNRELAVQIRSLAGFNYLADVFNYDWTKQGGDPIPTGPPGEPDNLRLVKSGSNITFSWDAPSNGCNHHSYSIYGGSLSSFSSGSYSHNTAVVCDVGSLTDTIPIAGLSTVQYFLVTANNSVKEGSYGRNTASQERPVSTVSCQAYQDNNSCP